MAKTEIKINSGSDELLAADIASSALELPPARRAAYLQRQYAQHPRLRPIVEQMMRDNGTVEEFLERSPVPRPPTMGPNAAPGEPRRLQANETLGDFKVERVLGRGGFATVYLARQLSLDREIALKVTPNRGQEARILAHLEHDHIVKVYSQTLDEKGSTRLMCMQYVRGTTLGHVIEELGKTRDAANGASVMEIAARLAGPQRSDRGLTGEADITLSSLDLQEVTLWLGGVLASALGYAHERGVLHLDVKPSNVLMSTTGRPFLTDFNVSLDARALGEKGPLSLGGTESYMAPEHRELLANLTREGMKKIDHRADIYSLGVVMKELIMSASRVGRPAKRAGHTVMLKDLRPVSSEVDAFENWKHIDTATRFVIAKCLAQQPKDRFQSAQALKLACDGCLEVRGIMKSLPPLGSLLSVAARFPRFVLTICGTAPLIAASAATLAAARWTFGAASDIDGRLGLAAAVLGGLHFVMLFFWGRHLSKLLEGIYRPARALHDPSLTERMRLGTLVLSRRPFAWATMLWLPGVLFALGWPAARLDWFRDYAGSRLLLGACLAGLFASALSAILIEIISLKAIYPRCWLGSMSVREIASAELSACRGQMRMHYVLLALAPSLAAIATFLDPTFALESRGVVAAALAVASLVAISIAVSTSHSLAQFIFAFATRGRRAGRDR